MAYITTSDITDVTITAFGNTIIGNYITESTSAVDDIAEKLGVESEDIETSPVHYKVKRYAICFVCMRICQDYMGRNNVEMPEIEKYLIKYNLYKAECNALEKEITEQMLLGTVDEQRDRAGVMSATIFRG